MAKLTPMPRETLISFPALDFILVDDPVSMIIVRPDNSHSVISNHFGNDRFPFGPRNFANS